MKRSLTDRQSGCTASKQRDDYHDLILTPHYVHTPEQRMQKTFFVRQSLLWCSSVLVTVKLEASCVLYLCSDKVVQRRLSGVIGLTAVCIIFVIGRFSIV